MICLKQPYLTALFKCITEEISKIDILSQNDPIWGHENIVKIRRNPGPKNNRVVTCTLFVIAFN